MSEEDNGQKTETQKILPSREMDPRCPLGLTKFPTTPCPLAVKRLERLKRLQGQGQHLQEQDWTDDCPYAIADKNSCYCFFSYIRAHEGESHDIVRISELLLVTQPSVYSAVARAQESIKSGDLLDLLKGDK